MFVNYLSSFKNLNNILLISSMVLLVSACSPANMVVKNEKFNIQTVTPSAGKAVLVVARTTMFGGAINFHTYLERNIIGVTRGRGCFIKNDIDPGEKYIIAKSESFETGKINFEPDHVYYVQQSPRIGWVVARITMTPVTLEHLLSEIGDGCTLYEQDSKNPGENLTEDEYKEAITDYERELKEGYHKEFTDYKGFKIMK